MRIRAFTSLVVALSFGLGFTPTPAHAAPAGSIHLPDLVMAEPTDLIVRWSGGHRYLHTSTTAFNIGDGPLELKPKNIPDQDLTKAKQRKYTHDAAGVWSRVPPPHLAGVFEFHDEHDHWHFNDFAEYAIHARNADGSVGDELRSSEKVSFCVADTATWGTPLEHTMQRSYSATTACRQRGIQGISVGWGDTYTWNTPGQRIDITGLPSTTYWLVVTVDPVNRLQETNDANNSYSKLVTLY